MEERRVGLDETQLHTYTRNTQVGILLRGGVLKSGQFKEDFSLI